MALSYSTPSLNTGFYGDVQSAVDTPTSAGASYIRWRGGLTGPPNRVAFTLGAGSRPLQQMVFHV